MKTVFAVAGRLPFGQPFQYRPNSQNFTENAVKKHKNKAKTNIFKNKIVQVCMRLTSGSNLFAVFMSTSDTMFLQFVNGLSYVSTCLLKILNLKFRTPKNTDSAF